VPGREQVREGDGRWRLENMDHSYWARQARVSYGP
jgi:hypothetical protein